MFWKYNYAVSPQIELLLEKEDITLSELMEEEDILQECKAQNKKLIEFLLRPNILEQLVRLIITEPDQEVDENYRYRLSNIACEILTCDLPALNERLSADGTLMETLYSFVKQEPPLNPLLCSFFSKTLAMLITRHNEQNWYSYQFSCLQVVEFLKSQLDCVSTLLKHIGTPAMMDLVFKLISQVEGNDMRTSVINWLISENVVTCLADLLKPQHGCDVHCNVSQLLCDVVRADRDAIAEHADTNCILTKLETPETISLILQNILEPPMMESSIVGGIQFLLVLLDQHERCAMQYNIDNNTKKDNDSAHQKGLFEALLPYLKDFHDILINPPEQNPIKTTAGYLEIPLGNARLQIARFICILLAENYVPTFCDKLAELGVMETLLDLFFKYSWNNFLHGYVEKSIASILLQNNSEVTNLQRRLFVQGKIIQRMIEEWNNNNDQQAQGDGVRKGYMGHIIKIINHIDSVTNEELNDFIKSVLSEDIAVQESWNVFVSGSLKDIIETQNVLLGGVHPIHCKSNDLSEELQLDVFINGLNMDSVYNDSSPNDEWQINADSDDFCLKSNDDPWSNNDEKLSVESSSDAFDKVQDETEWADFSSDNFADFDSNFGQFNASPLLATAENIQNVTESHNMEDSEENKLSEELPREENTLPDITFEDLSKNDDVSIVNNESNQSHSNEAILNL